MAYNLPLMKLTYKKKWVINSVRCRGVCLGHYLLTKAGMKASGNRWFDIDWHMLTQNWDLVVFFQLRSLALVSNYISLKFNYVTWLHWRAAMLLAPLTLRYTFQALLCLDHLYFIHFLSRACSWRAHGVLNYYKYYNHKAGNSCYYSVQSLLSSRLL